MPTAPVALVCYSHGPHDPRVEPPRRPRARSGAAIAVPVAWDDLSIRLRPDTYTVRTVKKYLKDYPSDPWEGYPELQQPLTLLDEK